MDSLGRACLNQKKTLPKKVVPSLFLLPFLLQPLHSTPLKKMVSCQITRLMPIIPAPRLQQSFLCLGPEAFLRPPDEPQNCRSALLWFTIKLHA
jgi:hypothetical protein